MFGYMTELDTVEEQQTEEITAQGDDLVSLLFHFLDELLFLFSADPFFVPKVHICSTTIIMSLFHLSESGDNKF